MVKKVFEYIRLMASSFLITFAVKFFFGSHSLAPGGTTGLAIILSSLTKIPVQYITISISLPLLILATLLLGKSFGVKTLFVTICTPTVMGLIPYYEVTSSVILSALLGGVCVGAAIANCLMLGAATGGTDTISLLIRLLLKRVPLRLIMFAVDGSVILVSGLISRNFMIAVYSLLSLLVILTVINSLMSICPAPPRGDDKTKVHRTII